MNGYIEQGYIKCAICLSDNFSDLALNFRKRYWVAGEHLKLLMDCDPEANFCIRNNE